MKKSTSILLAYILYGPLIGCLIFPIAHFFVNFLMSNLNHDFNGTIQLGDMMLKMMPVTLIFVYLVGFIPATCTGVYACIFMRQRSFSLLRFSGYLVTAIVSSAIIPAQSMKGNIWKKAECGAFGCHVNMAFVIAATSVVTAIIMQRLFRSRLYSVPETLASPSAA